MAEHLIKARRRSELQKQQKRRVPRVLPLAAKRRTLPRKVLLNQRQRGREEDLLVRLQPPPSQEDESLEAERLKRNKKKRKKRKLARKWRWQRKIRLIWRKLRKRFRESTMKRRKSTFLSSRMKSICRENEMPRLKSWRTALIS